MLQHFKLNSLDYIKFPNHSALFTCFVDFSFELRKIKKNDIYKVKTINSVPKITLNVKDLSTPTI